MDTVKAKPPQRPAGTFAASTAATLAMVAAFLLAGPAYAALIEISIPPSSTPLPTVKGLAAEWDADVDPSFLPWEDPSWGSALNVLAADHATGRRLGFGVHSVPGSGAAFPPLSDIAIPVPINPSHHDAWDTGVVQTGPIPDLWATLLIAAGLIAYQIRRKLRTGAVRIKSKGLGIGTAPSGASGNPISRHGTPASVASETS